MDYPIVQVHDLSKEKLQDLLKRFSPRGVNLGDKEFEKQVDAQIARLRGQGGLRFLLTWTGSKVPRGANVFGHIVMWTQNGQVTTQTGIDIGTYDRLVEFGGPSHNEQMMIVYLYPNFS